MKTDVDAEESAPVLARLRRVAGGGPQDSPDWRLALEPLQLCRAQGFFGRLLGLHAWTAWGERPRGLLLPGCFAVHTFGLDHAIDLVFLGADGQIVDVVCALGRNRWKVRWKARAVLELPAGYCTMPGWRAQIESAWRAWKMES